MVHALSSIKHSTAQNNSTMQYKARHDITVLFVEGLDLLALAAVIPCHHARTLWQTMLMIIIWKHGALYNM